MIRYINSVLSIESPYNAIEQFKKDLKIKANQPDESEIAIILMKLGYCHLWTCDYKKSIDYHIRSIEILKQNTNINSIMLCKIGISQAYNFLSDYEEVEKINSELERMVLNTTDAFAQSNVKMNSAIYNSMRGRFGRSKKYALDVYHLCGAKKLWYPYTTACNLLGFIHLEVGEITAAKDYLEKARKLMEKYKMLPQFTLFNDYLRPEALWAEYILNKHSFSRKQASNHLEKIKILCQEALAKTEPWPTHYGAALRVTAKYHALIDEHEKAEAYFLKSISHCSKLGIRYDLGMTFFYYSFYLKDIGKHEESILKLKSAHRIFKEIGSKLYLKRTSALLNLSNRDLTFEPDIEEEIPSPADISHKLETAKDLDSLLKEILSLSIKGTSAEKGFFCVVNNNNKILFKTAQNMGNKELSKTLHRIDEIEKANDESTLFTNKKVGENNFLICYLDKLGSGFCFNNDAITFFSSIVSHAALKIENALLSQKLEKRNKNDYPITEITEQKLIKALAYIKKNYTSDITRETLASFLSINPDNFGRFFKKYQGMKISDYTNLLRVEDAAKKIKETDQKIIDIAYSVGFNSLSTFNRVFLNIMKTTPSEYRKKWKKKLN